MKFTRRGLGEGGCCRGVRHNAPPLPLEGLIPRAYRGETLIDIENHLDVTCYEIWVVVIGEGNMFKSGRCALDKYFSFCTHFL